MSVEISQIKLPMTKLREENELPLLRDLSTARACRDAGLLPDERAGFLEDTGFRVLPYRMQDAYDSEPTEQTLPMLVLENQHLRASFLPTLGGRLISLFDKHKNRECLFGVERIRLTNMALRNAWFPGGIEWNFGHFGHSFYTCTPVHFAECRDENGQPFLRMYAFERCHATLLQLDFHLPEGERALVCHMVCLNPNPESAPFFLWTNAALSDQGNPRVFSGTGDVIIQRRDAADAEASYTHAALPDPYGEGVDRSYLRAEPRAGEMFFQNAATTDAAYAATAYEDGRMFIDRSFGSFPYRKAFCWGSEDRDRSFIELQAGCAKSQLHGARLQPGEALHFTQLFTPYEADQSLFSGEYAQATANVKALVDRALPAAHVDQWHARCLLEWNKPARRMLHKGPGWGALELARDPSYFPAHLDFPAEEIGDEQRPWLALARGKPFRGAGSFQIAKRWLALLEDAAQHEESNAHLLLHLGIARSEQLDKTGAIIAWTRSLQAEPYPMTHRCLAFLQAQQGDFESALVQMRHALDLLNRPVRDYAEEYLLMQIDAGQCEQAYAYFASLPEPMQKGRRMSMIATLAALEMGDDQLVDPQFARSFAQYKEGERNFTDAWFKRELRRQIGVAGAPGGQSIL